MDVGVVLPQTSWPDALEAALHADEIGADSVWVVDHVLGFPVERGILEAWTVMSAVAASTSRVEIGAQVLCQSFRNPALLAKMASTLDMISEGRLRMLIGAGWFQAEYEQFGWEFPSSGQRVEELRDAVRILKGLVNEDPPFTYDGRQHSVREAQNVPRPGRRLPIEVGAAGDRMLRLIAGEADGWNCPGAALPVLDDRLAFLAKACADHGRSIGDLRLSCQIVCAVGDDEAAGHPRLSFFSPQLGLIGSVEDATRRATELAEKGITGFHCIVPPGERGRACLERLVSEVRPGVG